eukprot:3923166-Prymnesium_polylepis.1
MSDIAHFRSLSPRGTTVVVENCNSWNISKAGSWGGIAAVSDAYIRAVRRGWIAAEQQLTLGDCYGSDPSRTCRELCVGRWL